MREDLDGTVPHDGRVSLAWIAQLGRRFKRLSADSHPLVEAPGEPLVVGRRQKDVHSKGPELAFARSRTHPGPASLPRRRIDRHDGGPPLVEEGRQLATIQPCLHVHDARLVVQDHNVQTAADRYVDTDDKAASADWQAREIPLMRQVPNISSAPNVVSWRLHTPAPIGASRTGRQPTCRELPAMAAPVTAR